MTAKTRITIIDIALYTTVITCIELAKEWNLIGAVGLRQYDFFDWLIMAVSVWAVAGVTIHAYFTNRVVVGNPPEPPKP
jgi:hypothetical protein